jgi:hypothetical protein
MAGHCLKLLLVEEQSFISTLEGEIKMITNKEDKQALNNINELPCCSQLETEPELDVIDRNNNLAFPVSKPKPTRETVDIEALFQQRLQRQLE